MLILIGFVIAFVTAFLKAFQIKNIVGHSYMLATITSVVMGMLNIAFIGIVAKAAVGDESWLNAIPLIVGGTIGVILSMYIHTKYVKKDVK